jgi:copper/silver efflux system protein
MEAASMGTTDIEPRGPLNKLIAFCLQNKLIVAIAALFVITWGLMVAPFDFELGNLPRDPVPVDAIPDIGENQQIVFTQWAGRSPQDVEDQVTYPLTVSLLGIPGIKTIRSNSMIGFSSIYVIFNDDVEFYWSRSRVLEKLSSLAPGILPDGVQPTLGPDATALGQVFWYTLEGRDADGNPAGGWDLGELRTIQDWQVRYALMSAKGVSEVASVGGFVKEYQIDVDPDAMRIAGVSLEEVVAAARMSNKDVGARTIEVNQVEYVVRGIGFIKTVGDLENAVIKSRDNVPIYLKDVAAISLGPALRRGALDKEGAEAVGGVVVTRYGENPLATIRNIKAKISEISPGLPRKTLVDGTVSQVTIVPFYDRSGLILETLDTLRSALLLEILVTIIVVLMMVMYVRSSLLISGLLPVAVLICFIGMKLFKVDANIVALSGIAIAIGTIVDMGIIITENIIKHLESAPASESRLSAIYRATSEVAGAVLTAVATTVISFLPVFTMEAAEGKLFKPLAYTKSFALIASVLVALTLLPPVAHLIMRRRSESRSGMAEKLIGPLLRRYRRGKSQQTPLSAEQVGRWVVIAILTFLTLSLLSKEWQPVGPEQGMIRNFIFVLFLIGGLLGGFHLFLRVYPAILGWCLDNKAKFLVIPTLIVLAGGLVWQGWDAFGGWLPEKVRSLRPIVQLAHAFPGLGKEFMPPLDEGSYLLMPTTMPHASIGEAMDVLAKQDMSIRQIPEVSEVVGKIGRVDSPLDPAPVSMIETVINYYPEYFESDTGERLLFRFDKKRNDLFRTLDGEAVAAPDGETYIVTGRFARDKLGNLIPDTKGKPFRIWRPALDPDLNEGRDEWAGIDKPDDIWDRIVDAANVPGTTSAPKLQPISTRIVMLQSGMRAPMGVKVKGPTLEAIEQTGLAIEQLLKEVPEVEPSSVFADRIVGKPYLEIEVDREQIARYGLHMQKVQDVIETAVGGRRVGTTVEGRERYPIRVRYQRELRDNIEALEQIKVATPGGAQIPLIQLADISYVRGPQMIKSEDTFLIGYVLFDKKSQYAEVDVVNKAGEYLTAMIQSGELEIPAGVSFTFAGSYENQIRSEKKLMVVLPLALLLIIMILYLQFRSLSTTMLVFSGISVAWAGGFLMLWLYGRSWFLDFPIFGVDMRELFQVHPINLSVAVWVGFLALFGIATDDGVVIATYLKQTFKKRLPRSISDIRAATIEASLRRSRPCIMTTATTILALVPVITSQGRGADVMVPMAIPSFGGMTVVVITMLVVPVLYSALAERKLAIAQRNAKAAR